jgi:AmmeMemoRadiSam system protein A
MRKTLLAVVVGSVWLAGCEGGRGNEGRPAGTDASVPAAPAEEAVMLKEHRSGEWTPGLSAAEMQTLFAIANDTLDACVRDPRGAFSFEKYTLTDKLRQPLGTFVTLKIGDRLRGCIGSLVAVEPLYESVHNNAVNAALRDHRFRPLTADERPLLDVHLSILSPITDIRSLDEFKLGEHGIIIEKGPYRAVYLPEVAIEQKWTKEETLSSLSEKAGMAPDAWRQGARFKIFSSVVISK